LITIHLNKLEFFAHHGLHDEEEVIGTTFEVSVAIMFEPKEKVISIHQTINYVDVYDVIKKHMIHPVALLEMLAENITDSISLLDKRIRNINIIINKKHPPIKNFIGEVGVSYQKVFDL
jgi:dihydroneopterin aldolase